VMVRDKNSNEVYFEHSVKEGETLDTHFPFRSHI